MGTSAPTSSHFRPSLDTVGATASLACAVHCAVVALLLGGLPAASAFAAPWIDWAFLALSLMIGIVALVPGYRRHRQRAPLMLFSAGIAVLVSLRSLHVPSPITEMLLVVVAASLLVAAHWRNRGALHSCACGPRHH